MNRSSLKLLIVFFTAFSLLSLPGSLSANFHLPGILPAHASPAPLENWYPGGPAMDTEQATIFTDATAEFANLQSSTPTIDLTDEPLPPNLTGPLISIPNFYVTSTVSLHRYYDLQFLLVANFWGCNFNFGNAPCGIQIRQGIAHMMDRAAFANTEPSIVGQATAIDSPLPLNNGGLYPANPCAWDANFTQSGTNCVVGAPGGTAYRLGAAAGANGWPWLQAPGSLDLNAAAQHFVNAGLATGFNRTTSILTGINSAAASHPVNIFIRNDDQPRLHLGQGIADQICYLFTGSYTFPCTYVTTTFGPIVAFPGYITSRTGVNLSWGIYTGAFSEIYPFDASLYFTYNSRFVSGIPSIQPPNGPCSTQAVPSSSAPDYMYLCNPAYDSISSQMEFAPCLTAPGDPVPGAQSNFPSGTDGICPGTSQLSSISAGIQTEDSYGRGEYSIPVFDMTAAQYAYLPNWQRVVNGDGVGIPNFFTWLGAYSPNAAVAGTVRQGFSQTTSSVNPYAGETRHDFYIVGNVYDSLMRENPASNSQLIDWMILNEFSLSNQQLTYRSPAGTVQTLRFTLRSDLFFQDGRKVTSFDVAFSYLSMLASGAFQASGLSNVAGITVLGPTQFDINLNGIGPFTLDHLAQLTILPARYWTGVGSGAWDSAISSCTMMSAPCYPAQYTLGPTSTSGPAPVQCTLTCTFSAANMNVDPSKVSVTYDPIANHIFVGSGPWQCGIVTSGGSGTCSPGPIQNPPVGSSYILTRFGKGLAPASNISSIYSRSGGTMALWTWSQDDGDSQHDFLNFAIVAGCFGTTSPNCTHWMMGIGGCGGTITSPCTIGITQVVIVNRFVGTNWVGPFNWQSSPPTGIASFAPVIYEGAFTLNPASVAGCTELYPTGGYDC